MPHPDPLRTLPRESASFWTCPELLPVASTSARWRGRRGCTSVFLTGMRKLACLRDGCDWSLHQLRAECEPRVALGCLTFAKQPDFPTSPAHAFLPRDREGTTHIFPRLCCISRPTQQCDPMTDCVVTVRLKRIGWIPLELRRQFPAGSRSRHQSIRISVQESEGCAVPDRPPESSKPASNSRDHEWTALEVVPVSRDLAIPHHAGHSKESPRSRSPQQG